MSWHEEKDGPRGLDEELRWVLGGSAEHFDYDALVAGTKVRARRIRRRRAVAQGVAAVVLVPTLVGTGFLVNSSLQGREAGSTGPAASSSADVSATQDDATQTSVAVQDGPPFQDADLLPEAPAPETNPDLPNRWQVPDVRPTGIDFLDAFGAPRTVLAYPRTVPLAGMVSTGEGVEPHSAASWSFHDGTNDVEQETVDITVTGWDDAATAMAALRADAPVTDARWDGDLMVRPWPAHHDTEHLMVDLPGTPLPTVGALIRQGDYLVGVTVQAGTVEVAAEAAGRIAEQSAANLAHLDPEHARTEVDLPGDDGTTDPTASAGEPPYQDAALLADAPMGVDDQGVTNRIEIPDVRPTGIDAMRAPGMFSSYANLAPVDSVATTVPEGTAPHSARRWTYGGAAGGQIGITLTAWDDSRFALDGLVGGGTGVTARWLGPDAEPTAPEPMAWEGHEEDSDYFLTWQRQWLDDPFAPEVAVALVRQGDYLVAVSVGALSGADSLDVAAEIAEKTAANLAVLDPEHGTD